VGRGGREEGELGPERGELGHGGKRKGEGGVRWRAELLGVGGRAVGGGVGLRARIERGRDLSSSFFPFCFSFIQKSISNPFYIQC